MEDYTGLKTENEDTKLNIINNENIFTLFKWSFSSEWNPKMFNCLLY